MIQYFSFWSAAILFVTAAAAVADGPATAPTSAPATAPTTAPISINWDQARGHIGQTATVTGPVVGIHDFGGAAVLNVGKNFPDPTRFTVFISKEKRGGMPDDLDNGKTISVTGKLVLFHSLAEIQADAASITISGQAPMAPATQP